MSDTSTTEIPRGWQARPLGYVADVAWGDLQTTKASYTEEGFVAYSASGADGFLPKFDYDEDGIVLSAIGAACGKTWFATGKWSCIKNTMRILKRSDAVLIHFLALQLSDPNIWPKRGTGQPFIGQKDAREMLILVPKLAEQEKIVEILEEQFSRLDAALTSVRTVRAKAAQFRRSLLHAAFSGALTGHDISSGIRPEGWEMKRLDSIADVQLGRQRSPQHHQGPNMRPYLRAANVTWKGLDVTDVIQMNFTDEEMKTYCLVFGDILVNEASGSASEVGKAVIFRGEIDDCGFQNHLIRVRVKEVGLLYLHHFLVHNAVSGAYIRESQGVGINHLGKAKLAAWPVPVPPLAEQEKIVEILEEQLSRLDAALVAADAMEKRAAALRRSLLHSAFTGQITKHWRESKS